MAEEAVLDEPVADQPDESAAEVTSEAEAEQETETNETTEAESEETGEGEPEPPESSTGKDDEGGSFQKRIDELTARYYQAKQEADYWQSQAKQEPEPVQAEQAQKTLADFDYDEQQYSAYLVGQAKAEARAEAQAESQKQQRLARNAEFQKREAEFSTTVEDYEQVTRNPALPITESMVDVLSTAEKGPEVLYYLGKHPDIAIKLAGMNPLEAAREIGRIEVTKLVPPPPPESKTPPPPPRLKGADNVIEQDPGDMSQSQFEKWRAKQIANR